MKYDNSLLPEEMPLEFMVDFRGGDHAAFEKVYHYFYRRLCFWASQMISNPEEAEDIVKDVFVKLWLKRSAFELFSKIKSFLYVSVRNSCLNFLRHGKVAAHYEIEYTYLESEKTDPLTLNYIIQSEVLEQVFTAVELLPPKRKEIFILAWIEEWTNTEIADFLNISIFTVKEQKNKGIRSIRNYFRDLPD